METIESKKLRVVGITEEIKDGFKITHVVKFISFSSVLKPDKILSAFKSKRKNQVKTDSKKLQQVRIHNERLGVKLLCNCFEDELNEKVNFYIEKYDTINNGWNTVERIED
jgi:SUMO ligase MMS21 Smc5/6 complex component